MSVPIARMRDQLRRWVPWWLSDRRFSSGKTVGFRYLWAMIACFDAITQWILEGLLAAWPGAGTLTALSLIGRSRGILRGQTDTDVEYASKLRQWLDKWAAAGSARQLAIELHEYLGNRPMVRVITRAGFWVTVAADGTVTTTQATWNWDGTSHPERAGFWSEMWIIIYPTQWANAGAWGDGRTWGGRDSGLGHRTTRDSYQAVKSLISQWKSAHTRVRAVLWTSDATRYDPASPATCPNGTWGEWGTTGDGARVASGRDLTTTRYWEP
jgi:hypothetical protein